MVKDRRTDRAPNQGITLSGRYQPLFALDQPTFAPPHRIFCLQGGLTRAESGGSAGKQARGEGEGGGNRDGNEAQEDAAAGPGDHLPLLNTRSQPSF